MTISNQRIGHRHASPIGLARSPRRSGLMIAGPGSDRAPVVQKPSRVMVSGRNHWQTAEAKNTRRQRRAHARLRTLKRNVTIGAAVKQRVSVQAPTS
jgi:hypothetical protein